MEKNNLETRSNLLGPAFLTSPIEGTPRRQIRSITSINLGAKAEQTNTGKANLLANPEQPTETVFIRKLTKKTSFIPVARSQQQAEPLVVEEKFEVHAKELSSSSESDRSMKNEENEKDIQDIVESLLPKKATPGNGEGVFQDVPIQFFLELTDINDYERIKIDYEIYPDKYGYHSLRKPFKYAAVTVSYFCKFIIGNSLFENISLGVIILNCVFMILTTQEHSDYEFIDDNKNKIEDIFFYFFVFELTFKIFSQGLFFSRTAYLRDPWNTMDFFIIVTSCISRVITDDLGGNFLILRGLRVLRPLRAVTKLRSLQIIITSLFAAMPMLAESFLVLLFFYSMYAIIGLQVFSGILKKRCLKPETGLYDQDFICGNLECPEGYICAKIIENPNYGVTNFDTFFYSFLQVFQLVTLEDWTKIMYYTQKAFTNYVWIYFISLVFLGSFFLVNLTLTVIKVKFSEKQMDLMSRKQIENKKKRKFYNFHLMLTKGIWKKRQYIVNLFHQQKMKIIAGEDIRNLIKKNDGIFENVRLSGNFAMRKSSLPCIRKKKKGVTGVNFLQNHSKFKNPDNQPSGYKKLIDIAQKNFKDMFREADVDSQQEKMTQRIRIARLKLLAYLTLTGSLKKSEKDNFNSVEGKYLKVNVNHEKAYNCTSLEDVLVEKLLKSRKSKKLYELRQISTMKKSKMTFVYKLSESEKYMLRNDIYSKILLYSTLDDTGKKTRLSFLPIIKKRRSKNLLINLGANKKNQRKKKSSLLSSVNSSDTEEFYKPEEFKTKEIKGSLIFDGSLQAAKSLLQVKFENTVKPIPDNQQVYLKILEDDFAKKVIKKKYWSGENVLKNVTLRIRKKKKIFQSLNNPTTEIWITGLYGMFIILRKYSKILVHSNFFENLMVSLVIVNTLMISSEGYISDELLDDQNFVFTMIFSVEMALKIFSEGPLKYLGDKLNFIDAYIVIFSLLEYYLDNKIFSAFKFLRSVRCVKIFRMFRIARSLKFMRIIILVILRSYSFFLYISLLLFIFNFIYALTGMSIFTDLDPQKPYYNYCNFSTFSYAFVTVFNIATLNNWVTLLYLGFTSSSGQILTSAFCITWIFIGNYILLNLFIAFILDSFTSNNPYIDEILKQQKEEEPIVEKDNIEYVKKQLRFIPGLFQQRTKGNLFDETFFFLSKTSKLRVICHKILMNPIFEKMVLFLIFLSSIKLIIDTYVEKDSMEDQILYIFEIILTICFSCEALVRIIATGFLIGKSSYLQDYYNVLDFILLISSIASLLIDKVDLPALKVLRLCRYLRPLSLISRNANIKLMVVALLDSVSGILNVLFILVIVWLTFSNLGLSLFRGRFNYCKTPTTYGIGKQECLEKGLNWELFDYNFENVYEALFTLLSVSTFDNWEIIMHFAASSASSDTGPIKSNYSFVSYVYFISFIIIVSLFFLNLFTAVIFYNFSSAQKKLKNIYMTESQIRWIKIQRMILSAEPHQYSKSVPKTKVQEIFLKIIRTRLFEALLSLIIILSIAVLAIPYDGQPEQYSNMVQSANKVFSFFFLAEMIIKFLALGVRTYFSIAWNRFDFFLVICEMVDYLIEVVLQDTLKLEIGSKLLRTIRALRVIRHVKLVRKFRGITKLLYTLFFSLPIIMNILALMALVFIMYSVLACSMLKDIPKEGIFDDQINFKNFSYAFMTLFKMSTADDWSTVFVQSLKYSSKKVCNKSKIIFFVYLKGFSAPLFLSFMLITKLILMNMFILIMLQQFEEYHIASNNPLQIFKNRLEKFKEVWSEFTQKEKGKRLLEKNLYKFFTSLKPPLGFKSWSRKEDVMRSIMKMNIKCDENGYIGFQYLLYKSMRRVYGAEVFSNFNKDLKAELRKIEKLSRLKIETREKSQKSITDQKGANETEANKEKHINPLREWLFMRLIFHSWLGFKNKYYNPKPIIGKVISPRQRKTKNIRTMLRESEYQEKKSPVDKEGAIYQKIEIKFTNDESLDKQQSNKIFSTEYELNESLKPLVKEKVLETRKIQESDSNINYPNYIDESSLGIGLDINFGNN